jgi:hypothetical protein
MVFKVKGVLDFYPKDVSKKHEEQSSWKRTALIRTNCDLDRYYGWFLTKRFNLKLNNNLRGSHVSIINDKMDKDIFTQGAKFFHGKEVEFYYENVYNSNGTHWWVNVKCSDANSIRESLGLTPDPYFGLHLTIGHVNEKYMYHSEYIYRQCKKFDLLSRSTIMKTY